MARQLSRGTDTVRIGHSRDLGWLVGLAAKSVRSASLVFNVRIASNRNHAPVLGLEQGSMMPALPIAVAAPAEILV
jgi:hypothetical protein